MAKYGPKAQAKIKKNIDEHEHHGKYKSRKQAIAVGISQSRRAGYKVPNQQ